MTALILELNAYWILVSVFSVGAVAYGVRLFYLTHRTRKWDETTATILSFDWTLTKYGGRPFVEYTYTIGSQTHRSSRITIDDFLITQGAWQVGRIRDKFPQGKQVVAFFNPHHPNESVLMQSSYGWSAFCILAGLIVFLGSLALPNE